MPFSRFSYYVCLFALPFRQLIQFGFEAPINLSHLEAINLNFVASHYASGLSMVEKLRKKGDASVAARVIFLGFFPFA
jgi:hypothetical protein